MTGTNGNAQRDHGMKRIRSAIILATVLAVWTGLFLIGKPAPVTPPEYDDIAEVQMDAIKIDANRFGAEKLRALLEKLRAVTPVSRLSARQVARPDVCFVVALTDGQGRRSSWSFFRDGQNYYMEAEDGSLYEGADFMAEYLAGDLGWYPVPRGVSAGTYLPDDEEAAYAAETGYDVRYWLYGELHWRNEEPGAADGEAVRAAEETILRKYRLYRYAVEHGYGIPDEAYDRLTSERAAEASEQENAAEAARIYEAVGITLEEHVRRMSGLIWRVEDTIDYMQFCFANEFREGSDTVDGVVYRSAGEYSAARMNEVVLTLSDCVDAAEFEAELKKAGQEYRERFG